MESRLKYRNSHFGVLIEISQENHVLLKYQPLHEVGLDEAKIIDQIIIDTIGEKEFTLICDFTDTYANMSKDAQKFLAREGKSVPYVIGNGIIVNNLPVRLLAKFYLNFFKPTYPAKIFSNQAAAHKWLGRINTVIKTT